MALTMSEFGSAVATPPEPPLRLLTSDDRPATPTAPSCRRSPSTGRPRAGRPRAGRRRAAAAVITAAAAVVALALPLAALGNHPAAGPGIVGPAAPSALPVQVRGGVGPFYVVRAGDTLASIAARLDPGHVRRAESRLAAELGSRVVVPGEHVAFG